MPPRNHRYPESHRLSGQLRFAAVRAGGLKDSRGPLTVRALPNDLPHGRLGIAIGRHCGNAVRRNRIKRLLREAYRLLRHDLPAGYDVVISVRAHEPLMLVEYEKILSTALVRLNADWGKRSL